MKINEYNHSFLTASLEKRVKELQKKTDSTDAEKEELAKCEKEASEVKELIPDISTKVCVSTCYSVLQLY